MTGRIFRSIFFVAVIALLSVFFLTSKIICDYSAVRYKNQIQNDARYIVHALNMSGQSYLHTFDFDDRNRITLIDTDGTVLFDSRADVSGMENHTHREEVEKAFKDGEGSSERYSTTVGERTYNYAIRLDNGMVIRISDTTYSTITIMFGMVQPLLIILIGVIIISAILASKVSKTIVKPLDKIDFENPENSDVYEELTPMLRRISSQNKQIQDQMDKLKRRQQEFITITENMSEGFIIIDSKTNILSYNESALDIFGVVNPPEKQSIFMLNRSEKFRNGVIEALKGRNNSHFLEIDHQIYQIFINSVSNFDDIYKDSEEHSIGAVIIILDVTDKEEQEKMRREFTANVSHELKTPLTSISGYAEIIKNGLVRQEDIPHFAGNIYSEAQRMILLIGDIMRLSQLDENSVPIMNENVDIYNVSEFILTRLKSLAAKNNITLELVGEHLSVMGNPQILDEMIFNIAENAVKYNKPDGKVTISVLGTDNGVKLSVADIGIGIPIADKDRVFERFYRVDKSHSKEIGGTGLGLSIVKHGAKYHNAAISLKSTPDKGTTIDIIFEKNYEEK